MNAAIDRFIHHLDRERGCSQHTVKNYRYILDLLLKWCAEHGISSWTEFSRDLALSFLDSHAVNRAHRVAILMSFLKWAGGEGILRDVSDGIVSPKAANRLPRLICHADLERLLTPVHPETVGSLCDQAALELGYACGLRIHELAGLTLDKISVEERTALIFGKGKKERMVAFGQPAAEAVKRWLELGRPKLPNLGFNHLLISRLGKPFTTAGLRFRFNLRAEAAGIQNKITPHGLRHSFATHMLEKGADLRVIQDLMGHSKLTTTEVYTRLDSARLRSVFDQCHPRAVA